MSTDRPAARGIVHDMRNQLGIAVANLESWRDGKLEPTASRITKVLDALEAVNALIDDLYRAGLPEPGPGGSKHRGI